MRAHVYLTLLCFTLVNAYQSHQGQSLMNNGIRQQRLQTFEALLVMVIDDEAGYYAIFHLEELLTLLGIRLIFVWQSNRVRSYTAMLSPKFLV
jgi:hypothetical protein